MNRRRLKLAGERIAAKIYVFLLLIIFAFISFHSFQIDSANAQPLDASKPLPPAKILSRAQVEAFYRQLSTLEQKLNSDLKIGDEEKAAIDAEACTDFIMFNNVPVSTGCESYYADALMNGRGVSKNVTKSFVIYNDLYTKSIDIDGPYLAKLYLDGIGTPPNPIMAKVMLWRYEHGATSF